MNVEVKHDNLSISIRYWPSGSEGQFWTIRKSFSLAPHGYTQTRVDPATVSISGQIGSLWGDSCATRQREKEFGQAAWIAERLDDVFVKPSDFERIVMADYSTGTDTPVWILPSHSSKKIYIVTAAQNEPND